VASDHWERPTFIGRDKEVEALRAKVRKVASGLGGVVLLTGEAGIGKTSLAQEITAYASDSGFEVIWGRCEETVGAPPYWPWTQLIRSYVEDREVAELRQVVGFAAPSIAHAVPELREKFPEVSPPTKWDPEEARFRLFDGVTSAFRNAAKRCPLILVLEDLHDADEGSLQLLEFLARRISIARLLVIATYRDFEVERSHVLHGTLAELLREPICHQIYLDGLSQQEVDRKSVV